MNSYMYRFKCPLCGNTLMRFVTEEQIGADSDINLICERARDPLGCGEEITVRASHGMRVNMNSLASRTDFFRAGYRAVQNSFFTSRIVFYDPLRPVRYQIDAGIGLSCYRKGRGVYAGAASGRTKFSTEPVRQGKALPITMAE